MKETVSIVGSHPKTRALFDFNRTDCDIWVFNEAMSTEWATRADAVFQLHIPIIWKNPNNRNDPKHYAWLKSGNTPLVFMQDKYPEVPMSVKFPKDEVLSMLPNAKANGETIKEMMSTPSWALAYAVYLGYKNIEVYGVELSSNTEYHYQQGNFKYWIGVAAGRGINVNVFSTMFDNPLYGYEGEVFIEYDEFKKRMDELRPDKEGMLNEFVSAAQTLGVVNGSLLEVDNKDEIISNVQNTIVLAAKTGELDGRLFENDRYIQKADAMKKEGGQFVFSRQEFEHAAAVREKEVVEQNAKINAMKGQLDLYHGSVALAARGSKKRKSLLEAYKAKQTELVKMNYKLGVLLGEKAENIRYMTRLGAGIKAAGGEKSEEAILSNV